MAKTPTDLSRDWWHKNKATTLKSTNLGQALGNWEAAWDACQQVMTRKYSNYDAAQAALAALKPAVATAKAACNKTLHGDTIKALDAYTKLIGNAAGVLMKHRTDYDKFVKDWADVRKQAKRDMVRGNTEMDTLIAKATEAVKACLVASKGTDAAAKTDAITKAQKRLQQLADLQQKINDDLSAARVPTLRTIQPHPDDFPGDAAPLFNECVTMQTQIVGKRGNAENALRAGIAKCQ